MATDLGSYPKKEDCYLAAVAIELLHLSSLIHDDIAGADGEFSLYVSDNFIEIYTTVNSIGKYYLSKINFCPMCGRELSDD